MLSAQVPTRIILTATQLPALEPDKYEAQMTDPTSIYYSTIGQQHSGEDVPHLFLTAVSNKLLNGLALVPTVRAEFPLDRDLGTADLGSGKQHSEIPKPLALQHNIHPSIERILENRSQGQARAADDQQISYNLVTWDSNGTFQQRSHVSLCPPVLAPDSSVRRDPAASDYSNYFRDWSVNKQGSHREVEHGHPHQLACHSDVHSRIFRTPEYEDGVRQAGSGQNRQDEAGGAANNISSFAPTFHTPHRGGTSGTQEEILNELIEYQEINSFVREDINSHPDNGHAQNQCHVPLTPYASLIDQKHPQNSVEEKRARDKSGPNYIRTKGVLHRRSAACTNCRRLKMKCVFQAGQSTCNRCRNLHKVCIVEGRELRQSTKEAFVQKVANNDTSIDSILRQVNNPATLNLVRHPPNRPAPRFTQSINRSPDRSVLPWIDLIKRSWNSSTQQNDDHQDLQGKFNPPHPLLAQPGENANNSENNPSSISFAAPSLSEPGNLEISINRCQTNAEQCDQSDHFSLSNLPTGSFVKHKAYGESNPPQNRAGTICVTEGGNQPVGVRKATDFRAQLVMAHHLSKTPTKEMPLPEILTRGIVASADVEVLFQLFFDKLNTWSAMLDPKVHTPAFVLERCSFLFTAICAVASRYHQNRRAICMDIMNLAESLATAILSDGLKSVEVVQAFLIMAVFPVPVRGVAKDRANFYLKTAIRMALDLNLNAPQHLLNLTGENTEWEMLNRARTWLVCFNIKQSGSIGFGRCGSIQEDDIVRSSQVWYKHSKYNSSHDIHEVAYTRLMRILARFFYNRSASSRTEGTQNEDKTSIAKVSNELDKFELEIYERFESESDHNDDSCEYRCNLLPFSFSNFARLIVFLSEYQHSLQHNYNHRKIILDKCYVAASEVMRIAIDVLAPSGRLMYALDVTFSCISFSAISLLKALKPQCASLVEPSRFSRIIQTVTRLADVLASDAVAIDNQHTPWLYSRFLKFLIARQCQSGTTIAKPMSFRSFGAAFSRTPSATSEISAPAAVFSTCKQRTGHQEIDENIRQRAVYAYGTASISDEAPFPDVGGTGAEQSQHAIIASFASQGPSWSDNFQLPHFNARYTGKVVD